MVVLPRPPPRVGYAHNGQQLVLRLAQWYLLWLNNKTDPNSVGSVGNIRANTCEGVAFLGLRHPLETCWLFSQAFGLRFSFACSVGLAPNEDTASAVISRPTNFFQPMANEPETPFRYVEGSMCL